MKEYRKVITKINGKDTALETEDMLFKDGVISIYGEINDELAAWVNSAIMNLAKSSNEDIILYINSPGGSVSAGLSIYDTCELCKQAGHDIVTVATGMAASMGAFLVTAAGTKGKRYMHPNCELMIHQPLGGTNGQATDIMIHAKHINMEKERINEILAECTGRTSMEIDVETDRDNYFFAKEAVSFGLVDKIGDPYIGK